MSATIGSLVAQASKPAGGAAISQVIIATAGAMVITAVLLWVMWAHRAGKIKWVGKLAGIAERQTGLPGWAALPTAFIGTSLLIAVFGMYWDISLHIAEGRDEGPLANPAHYFILFGLFGVFFCGIISMALTKGKPSIVSLKITRELWMPLGAMMILVCGSVSLLAFPMDDVWHRLFGQDVTLWGPTHLLLFGGASFSILGIWVLQVEAARTRGQDIPSDTWLQKLIHVSLAGALLIGMSTFQGEFDFGVPQFNQWWHPILLAIAAGVALVAARVRLGRGGALAAVAFFIALRGLLALLVGPVLGEPTPHFPLYIAEALCVELVALRWDKRKPLQMGAVAGALIGSVGFFAEYAWSQVWMINPWTPSLIPDALPLAILAGIGAGIVGGAIGRAFTPAAVGERPQGWLVAAGGALVIGVCVFATPESVPSDPPSATVTLAETQPAPEREAIVNVELDPPEAGDERRWLNVTAWQGGDQVVYQLEEVGDGTFRSPEPLPLYGNWKSTLRLQSNREVLGLPIYMPADPAIPVEGVPAPGTFTREFEDDKDLLQREVKEGVSPVLKTGAYIIVLLVAAIVGFLLVVGLRRLRRSLSEDKMGPPSATAADRQRTPQTSAA